MLSKTDPELWIFFPLFFYFFYTLSYQYNLVSSWIATSSKVEAALNKELLQLIDKIREFQKNINFIDQSYIIPQLQDDPELLLVNYTSDGLSPYSSS